jgi:hypothetical protein
MRGSAVGLSGVFFDSHYVEGRASAGLNRFAARNSAHFRPALTGCNCDGIAKAPAFGAYRIGKDA